MVGGDEGPGAGGAGMKVAIGMKFGRLTVVRLVSKRSLWECSCECGGTTTQRGNVLTSGRVCSCGCFRRELLPRWSTLHGATDTREFSIWKGIRKRCENERCAAYRHYGGRGIRMCERWSLFANFLADMGPCPPYHSIDRIDNDGNYEPGNCRWATQKTQVRNRQRTFTVEFYGRRMSLAEACEIAKQPYGRVRDRLKLLGWPTERALREPAQGSGR